jgi:RNase P subunit RPR2
MIECPYCGHNEYYKYSRVSGLAVTSYKFDGTMAYDNSQMHDGITYKELKTVYCGQCHKKLNLNKRVKI